MNQREFVGKTAQLMAAIRATEHERKEGLFTDAFAAKLAGTEGLAMLEEQSLPRDHAYALVRTRFFDDFMMEAVREASQVVVLGSGLDARAFRLTFPQGTKLFELDLPEVIERKETILKDASANCEHYMIKADLNQPWEHLLLEKGYQVSIPSVFLAEGLLGYLEEAQVHSLIQTISKLTATGSHLGLDLLDIGALKTPQGIVQEYFRSGFENVQDLLAMYNWDAKVFRAGENTFDYFHVYSQAFSTEKHQSYLVKAKKSNS